jgi:hypothetical protein
MINLLLQNNIKFSDNGKSVSILISPLMLIKIKNSCLIRKFINFILPVEAFFTVSRLYHFE